MVTVLLWLYTFDIVSKVSPKQKQKNMNIKKVLQRIRNEYRALHSTKQMVLVPKGITMIAISKKNMCALIDLVSICCCCAPLG
jgi:hypothetical protein